MNIKLTPSSRYGRYAVSGIILFFLSMIIFFTFVHMGERGGKTFFSNPKLYLPYLLASISGAFSFFTAAIALVKSRDYAILTILSLLLGLITILWNLGEILSPH